MEENLVVKEEVEKEDIVVVPMPISEAVRVSMGNCIENFVVKKFIRDSVVKECGMDEYLNMHDKITKEQNNKIDNLQKRIWELQAMIEEVGVKKSVYEANSKKKGKKEKDED